MKKLLVVFILSIVLLNVSFSHAKVPEIVLKQKKAVVTVYINDKDGKQIATGSGFIIGSNGIIATNYHVTSKWLETADNTILIKMENGAYFPVEDLIAFDDNNDIALLKVTGKDLPTIKFSTDYKPKQGESIVVIGSPFGLETTVSDGIISSMRGKNELIQITAPVSQGSSGSPVFNSKGEVIGIATFLIQGGQNLNFAIPMKYVQLLLNGYKKPKKKTEPPLAPAPTPTPDTNLLSELEKAKAEVKKNPDSAEAHYNLGQHYGFIATLEPEKGYTSEDAIEAYKQAVKIKPDYAEAYLFLGDEYRELKMYRDAISSYTQVLKIRPDAASAHSGLGFCYKELGMYQKAIDEFKQAIEINPNHEWAHYGLGVVYVHLNNKSLALEEYKFLKNLKFPDALMADSLSNSLFNLIYK